MHAGLYLLRLSPQAFWSLSPLEFAAMTGRFQQGDQSFTRQKLEALMAAFPD